MAHRISSLRACLFAHPLALFAATALVLSAAPATVAQAQSVNYRAQGHYYSAKAAFEKKDFATALAYVYRSKEALGGTNNELQYLHVLSAHRGGRGIEAQAEMQRFFELAENKLKPVQFSSSVARLTNDEITQLTMLINDVDDGAQAERAENARRERFNSPEERARRAALEEEKARRDAEAAQARQRACLERGIPLNRCP